MSSLFFKRKTFGTKKERPGFLRAIEQVSSQSHIQNYVFGYFEPSTSVLPVPQIFRKHLQVIKRGNTPNLGANPIDEEVTNDIIV